MIILIVEVRKLNPVEPMIDNPNKEKWTTFLIQRDCYFTLIIVWILLHKVTIMIQSQNCALSFRHRRCIPLVCHWILMEIWFKKKTIALFQLKGGGGWRKQNDGESQDEKKYLDKMEPWPSTWIEKRKIQRKVEILSKSEYQFVLLSKQALFWAKEIR